MKTLLAGLALTLSVSPAFAQVNWTQEDSRSGIPRSTPSKSLGESMRDIEALSSLLKGRPAEERRHLYQWRTPPQTPRPEDPALAPRSSPTQRGMSRWEREYEKEMGRLNQERPRSSERGAWDDLVRGRNVERWREIEREYHEPEYPDPSDYTTGHIEPGHVAYGCGHITNPQARRDCQETWQANNPNDRLHYGR